MKSATRLLCAVALCAITAPASAASLYVNTNFAAWTGSGDTYSYTTPTYPSSYVGVNFEAGYQAVEARASFEGRARFDLPTLAPGTVFTPDGAGNFNFGRVGVDHSFTSTSLTGGVDFFGKVNYSVGVWKFSDRGTIGEAHVTPTIDTSLNGGAPFGASISVQEVSAAAPSLGKAFRASAFGVEVGRAELSITPGIAASNRVEWKGDFTYGYYYWQNATGGLSATDTLRFVAASGPGFDLKTGPLYSGSSVLNVLPVVQMDAFLRQEQNLDFTISGKAFLRLFGDTLLDWNTTSRLNLFKDGQGFDITDQEWRSRFGWSVNIGCFGLINEGNALACEATGPDKQFEQIRLGDKDGRYRRIRDTPGGFRPSPGFTDLPDRQVCVGGVCYNVDDPSLPIDKFELISLGNAVPEPATWAMMLFGFGAVGWAMRRRSPSASQFELSSKQS